MANKEHTVIEILDVLRRHQAGDGSRTIAQATDIARNTVRKYIRLAQEKGLGGDSNADIEDIAYAVFREVHLNDNADDANTRDNILLLHKESIMEWLDCDRLTLTKAHIKLLREGMSLRPYRQLKTGSIISDLGYNIFPTLNLRRNNAHKNDTQ